ncbi:hypothetical protein [Methyloversatilis thermotolerans]|uniref:hypothetical protein n=1 Tax=Methyloversatilis thermotolerans TaxID=1346290 RepID=UPI0003730E05|nr:hypothetical protein [Methyloversatilis thermotolerans]
MTDQTGDDRQIESLRRMLDIVSDGGRDMMRIQTRSLAALGGLLAEAGQGDVAMPMGTQMSRLSTRLMQDGAEALRVSAHMVLDLQRAAIDMACDSMIAHAAAVDSGEDGAAAIRLERRQRSVVISFPDRRRAAG